MQFFGYGPLDATVGGYGHPWHAAFRPQIIPEQNYEEAEALDALRRRDRCVRYTCNVLTPDLVRIGSIPARNMRIDCNSDANIPMSMSAEVNLEDARMIDFGRARLQPVMELQMPDGGWYAWPLGVFVPTTPRMQLGAPVQTVDISGYDMTVVASEDRLAEVLTIPAGTQYIEALVTLLMQGGIQHITAERTDAALTHELQYDIGTDRLSIANELLRAIGYQPLYADANGFLRITRKLMPYERTVQHRYMDDELSVIAPELVIDEDMFAAPNMIVAVVSRLEDPPLVARWQNEDPQNPLSIHRRGRRVVRFDQLDDIQDQDVLDRYVIAEGYRTMAQYGRVNFETLAMPGHLVRDMVYLQREDADIAGRYMETGWSMELNVGASMRHTAQRVVTV